MLHIESALVAIVVVYATMIQAVIDPDEARTPRPLPHDAANKQRPPDPFPSPPQCPSHSCSFYTRACAGGTSTKQPWACQPNGGVFVLLAAAIVVDSCG